MQPRRRGELTFEGGTDMWAQGARWIIGGAGQPHMSTPRPSLQCGVFLSPLEPSGVGFTADKRDFILHFDPP